MAPNDLSGDLFVGITSWNSALFLPHCLDALRRTTSGIRTRICVIDNASSDASASLARERGAEVVVRSCTQVEALQQLVRSSRSRFTLLLHADVIVLAPDWFERCTARLGGNTVLISPEDIGCGPFTRPFGAGMPESSFLLFETAGLRRARNLVWRRRYRLPVPRRELDFYGDHVTHNIPRRLAQQGLTWQPMNVYISNAEREPLFIPDPDVTLWNDELGHLRYGLGNFYGIDGCITHYHNWYDRVITARAGQGSSTPSKAKREFPAAFINAYSQRFLADYQAGSIDLPRDLSTKRLPVAL
jgi:glycosyltransferase involved in cell wall biosynthesis